MAHKSLRRLVAALIVLGTMAVSGRAYAAPYQDGLVAYEQGQFIDAIREFRSLAVTGHPGAEFMLGVMHFNGFGVDRNEKVAAIYFRLAAEQGDAGAQLAFGSLHVRGIGVMQNLVEARKWLSICSRSATPELARQATALISATASLMTAAEISRADRDAERWRPVRAGLVRP